MENEKIENIIENMIDDYKENEQLISDNQYEYEHAAECGYEDYLKENDEWEDMTEQEKQEAKEKYEAGEFDYYIRQAEVLDQVESENLETKDIDKIIEAVENYYYDDFDYFIKEGLLNILKSNRDYIKNEWGYVKFKIIMKAGEYGIFKIESIN